MTNRDFSATGAIKAALKHHQQGNLRAAESAYRQVLENDPANPDALHLLGVIAFQSGKPDAAVELISRAIAVLGKIPDFHNNLGNALRALRRTDEAMASYRQALRLSPHYAEAHNNLGLALRDQSRCEEALACFRRALRLNPRLAEAHLNLGLTLNDLGRRQEAAACYQKALKLKPDYAEAHSNLGSVLKEEGRIAEATSRFSEALRLKPDLAEAHNNIGILMREEGRLENAIACFNEALRLNPALAEAHINLGALFQEQGQMREAIVHYERAMTLLPDQIAAKWGRCIAQIPILYESAEEISVSRSRYSRTLQELHSTVRLDCPAAVAAAARAVGGAQPFFLAYQGENDRELQRLYGELVCRIQSARYPQWAAAPPMPATGDGLPLRVGIVSAFFCYHSNWKIPIRGWVENLDPRRFALFGYYTGKKNDAETEIARRSFTKFFGNPASLEEMCRAIRNDQLHILIYPEVGMDPLTLRLAALRLAPIQCTSWGHPDTSGLPTIDYFLSSELMEPPDAENHYGENLVRLPNLSVYYAPLEIEPARGGRGSFGLREGAVLFLCAQSLFKYLPQHDQMLARIAREIGDCQFVFLGFGKSEDINRMFRRRLAKAFTQQGLDSERYVAFLPQQDPPHYMTLNQTCDIFLDSVGWSGCNSTLEAIACDLPVVTMPGSLMRSRHSHAILTMMGATETIAATQEEYVRIAVELAKNCDWRKSESRRIASLKYRLYRDRSCIEGLSAFLEEAVAKHARRNRDHGPHS